jgi:hypothetical protein
VGSIPAEVWYFILIVIREFDHNNRSSLRWSQGGLSSPMRAV